MRTAGARLSNHGLRVQLPRLAAIRSARFFLDPRCLSRRPRAFNPLIPGDPDLERLCSVAVLRYVIKNTSGRRSARPFAARSDPIGRRPKPANDWKATRPWRT
jgi:hypothetical protein